MTSILHVTSSPRQDQSHSTCLGRAMVRKLMNKNNQLMERDLTKDPPPFLSQTQLGAADGTRVGLFTGKKVYLAIASGGTPAKGQPDFVEAYLKAVLETVGMTDVHALKIEGTVGKTPSEADYKNIIP